MLVRSHVYDLRNCTKAGSWGPFLPDKSGRVNWQPTMGSFRVDHDGNWWFHLVGKGDKAAKVAVRPEYIDRYLKRYRRFMGLSELPLPHEQAPLIAVT